MLPICTSWYTFNQRCRGSTTRLHKPRLTRVTLHKSSAGTPENILPDRTEALVDG